ncbi:MAG: hypothetical protein MRZ98_08590 [Clostridiales bacterium]|nr:hypothetical protein [Clostridiales bacterium]
MKKFAVLLAFCLLLAGVAAAEEKVGGWNPAADPSITDEVMAVFEKGTEGLTGVDYVPVAYLGSQVVAGTNHCFLCQATVVYPDAEPGYALMYLYEDLQGNVSVMNIADLDIGAFCTYGAE